MNFHKKKICQQQHANLKRTKNYIIQPAKYGMINETAELCTKSISNDQHASENKTMDNNIYM